MILFGYSPITLPDGTTARGNLIKCVLQYYEHNVAETTIEIGGNISHKYQHRMCADNVLGAITMRLNLVPDH